MKILLDPQIFHQQIYGGISRYYTEIFTILSQKNDVNIVLPIYNSDNVYLKETNLTIKNKSLHLLYNILSFLKISTRTLRKKKSDQLLENKFQENDYDVFVPTYYNPYFVDKIKGKPFVLTVYDMIHELFPQYFKEDPFNVKEYKSQLIGKATKIIAVSHNTKKDILKIFPEINSNKIVVIHHGSSIKMDHNVKVNLPSDYILYVGSRADYKNFMLLVRSIEQILKENPTLILLAAGGGEFTKDEKNQIDRLGLKKQIVQQNFEENELSHFYKNAKCFVFPSLYEGFGIPVLESMASGCPIILSNSGSFPEVAGEAGIYFETNSENHLKEKIQMILQDENLQKLYAQKGLKQVEKFNWNIAAEQCLQVYKDAIKINADSQF